MTMKTKKIPIVFFRDACHFHIYIHYIGALTLLNWAFVGEANGYMSKCMSIEQSLQSFSFHPSSFASHTVVSFFSNPFRIFSHFVGKIHLSKWHMRCTGDVGVCNYYALHFWHHNQRPSRNCFKSRYPEVNPCNGLL